MSLDRFLENDFIRVTERAAIAAAKHHGLRQPRAVRPGRGRGDAPRSSTRCPCAARIVIGEGERDEAPMLYIGEQVGALQGDATATPRSTSPSIRSRAPTCAPPARPTPSRCSRRPSRAACCTPPTVYMDKLVVGPSCQGLRRISTRRSRRTCARWPRRSSATSRISIVVVLDRPRHEQLIADIRAAGARIRLIGDGDLSAGIAAAVRGTGVHAVMGIGGAPEGVITAAAMRCLGGEIMARLTALDDKQRARLHSLGLRRPRTRSTDRGPRPRRAHRLQRHRRHRRRAAQGRPLLRRRLAHLDPLHVAVAPDHPLRRHHPPRKHLRSGALQLTDAA